MAALFHARSAFSLTNPFKNYLVTNMVLCGKCNSVVVLQHLRAKIMVFSNTVW